MWRLLSVIAAAVLFGPAAAETETPIPDSPGLQLARAEKEEGVTADQPEEIAVTANGLAIQFFVTPLSAVVAKLGGKENEAEGADGFFVWACYTTQSAAGNGVVWFVAESVGSLWVVTRIVSETLDGAAPDSCVAPSAPLELNTGVPMVGASAADLEAAYGAPVPPSTDDGTATVFFGPKDENDDGDWGQYSARYRIADGKVTAAALVSKAPPVLDLPDTPAIQIAQDAEMKQGNIIKKGPPVQVKIEGIEQVILNITTLSEIDQKFGGRYRKLDTGGGSFAASCYTWAPTDGGPQQLVWFVSTAYTSDYVLKKIATEIAPSPLPEGCVTLETPVVFETGAPMVGATMEELEAAYSAAPKTDADGTVTWYFNGAKTGGGEIAYDEAKYRMVDGRAVAASIGQRWE